MERYKPIYKLEELTTDVVKPLQKIANKNLDDVQLDKELTKWFKLFIKSMEVDEKNDIREVITPSGFFGWLLINFPKINKVFLDIGLDKVENTFWKVLKKDAEYRKILESKINEKI